ncbi:MAG: hypothetical protein SGJ19_13050 [Planctomycetia bacterium]|nr:hypothetical protein [Planctomycetia bacterium]
MQAVLKRLRYWQLAHFSKPVADHPLYQAIRQREPRSFLEIGVGNAQRATRMIELASQTVDVSQLSYVGIDPFESRAPSKTPGLTLKQAHRTLKALGAKIRLVPGDPFAALSRTANELTGIELVVIAQDTDTAVLERAWFYLPRTLAADAIVLWAKPSKDPDGYRFDTLLRADVDRLANRPRRRAA